MPGSPKINPVSVRIEAYIVSQVTAEDGSVTERFSESTTARPGQVVEYRVFCDQQRRDDLTRRVGQCAWAGSRRVNLR